MQCIIKLWNALPTIAAMATCLDGFKRDPGKFLEEQAISGYNFDLRPIWCSG